MNDIYINERTGERYEVTPNNMTGNSTELVIKPVQKEEKQYSYNLDFSVLGGASFVDEDYSFTEFQGEAVATALRALMEYINDPITGDPSDANPAWRHHTQFQQKAEAARTAVQTKDKEVR